METMSLTNYNATCHGVHGGSRIIVITRGDERPRSTCRNEANSLKAKTNKQLFAGETSVEASFSSDSWRNGCNPSISSLIQLLHAHILDAQTFTHL